MSIRFFYTDTAFRFKRTSDIKSVLVQIFSDHHKTITSLSVVLCSDDYLLQINKNHLNHDYLTDVITFDLSEDDGIVGEIYVSSDRTRENAQAFYESMFSETCRVIFHGALHLVGFKDKSVKDIRTMRAAESKYLDILKRSFHVKPHL